MNRPQLTRRAALVGAAAASIAAVGGSAVALATAHSSSIYQGCLSRGVGTLYHVRLNPAARPRCNGHDTHISWNQTGPTGAPGSHGPTGATGPAGPQGPKRRHRGRRPNHVHWPPERCQWRFRRGAIRDQPGCQNAGSSRAASREPPNHRESSRRPRFRAPPTPATNCSLTSPTPTRWRLSAATSG
jgi:hypothetical protein